ncbi:toxin-antitoxin system YwqK family antitoxin [Actinomyces urogenitalis]|uniref:toxin-antitoxin system YwqK family antitoxin n=1 Tax=Actinomyces urogenitalis TaxID=103621 RepID=UPI0025518C47|nr:hypothetical protein [Actinomyces urogenitalis]MDK8237442.1 hypothetical protein [Actinomyces urogenitalis]WOO94239.1 hypothetical protein R3I39_05830 [Actinomyces urogenitalis]
MAVQPLASTFIGTDEHFNPDRLIYHYGQPARTGEQLPDLPGTQKMQWDLPDGHTVTWSKAFDGSVDCSYASGNHVDRADGPAVMSWYPNGQPSSMSWVRDGRVQAEGQTPAAVAWHPNGVVKTQTWADGQNPGMTIRYDKTGQMSARAFLDAQGKERRTEQFQDGRLHADGEAAVVTYDPMGRNTVEFWTHGRSERPLGVSVPSSSYVDATPDPLGEWCNPTTAAVDKRLGAEVARAQSSDGGQSVWRQRSTDRPDQAVAWNIGANGQTTVAFYQHGANGWELHRDDGPAVINFDANGQPRQAQWRQHGNLSREYGPAVQTWNERGQVTSEERHLAGAKLAGPTVIRLVDGQPVNFATAATPAHAVTSVQHQSSTSVQARPAASRTARLHQAAITGRATAFAEPRSHARPQRSPVVAQTQLAGRRM